MMASCCNFISCAQLRPRLLIAPIGHAPQSYTPYRLHRIVCASYDIGTYSGLSSLDSDDEVDVVESTLQTSPELRELCRLQLAVLLSALHTSLGTAIENNDISLKCAVYCRTAASLSNGKLQLHLVAASDPAFEAASSAQQRGDLFLGVPGTDGTYQEAWIVEQPIIVLPDSGGLVLPLSHNSFLVGLLAVERGVSEGSAVPANLTQAPACALLGPPELKLIKQSGSALALACAMDLRAALERASHAVRQREMRGLVQEVRKPLTTIRTLGAMLAPRLEMGEPDRDMAEGILAQGDRLSAMVGQLQSALHPISAPGLNLLSSGPSNSGSNGFNSRPIKLSSGNSSTRNSSSSGNVQQGGSGEGSASQQSSATLLPALPSSSIGADNWSPGTTQISSKSNSASDVQEPPPIDYPAHPSGLDTTNNNNNNSTAQGQADVATVEVVSSDLLTVLMPLLATASNFAGVSGVSFLLASDPGSNITPSATSEGSTASANTESREVEDTAGLPQATVAVEDNILKGLFSHQLDGIMGCASRGDSIRAEVRLMTWQGKHGVALMLCMLRGDTAPGANSNGHNGGANDLLSRAQIPEFNYLATAAEQVGGFFEVRYGDAQQVLGDEAPALHAERPALMASLWVPVVGAGQEAGPFSYTI